MRHLPAQKKPSEDGGLLNYAQAAAVLNVRVRWLQTQVQNRTVPHRRLGRQVRFSEDDLADIIASTRHAAVTKR